MSPVEQMARFRSVAGSVGWRSLHNFLTNKALLLPALMFPLFFFSAFAGGLSAFENNPEFDYPNGYTAFEFAFVVLQASAFGGVFTGFGIARDFESGFGRRLMLAAPNRLGILAGYVGAAMARSVLVVSMLFVLALLFGMEVTGGVVDITTLYIFALMVSCAASMFAAGIAMRFRSIQAGPLMQTPTFLFLFLAPVYVPIDLLTGWIQAIAEVNPITPIIEAIRSLIAGSPEDLGAAFLAAAGLIIFFGLFAYRGVRSAERAGG